MVVTRRGRRIARLSGLDAERPLEDLARRGLVRMPQGPRSARAPQVKCSGSAAASILAYPEERVGIAAARRRGRLGEAEHAQALAVFEELQGDLITVGVDSALTHHAGEYAEDLGLRGYDAVHLATALALGDEEVVVVTWDRDLAHATEQVGFSLAGLH